MQDSQGEGRRWGKIAADDQEDLEAFVRSTIRGEQGGSTHTPPPTHTHIYFVVAVHGADHTVQRGGHRDLGRPWNQQALARYAATHEIWKKTPCKQWFNGDYLGCACMRVGGCAHVCVNVFLFHISVPYISSFGCYCGSYNILLV